MTRHPIRFIFLALLLLVPGLQKASAQVIPEDPNTKERLLLHTDRDLMVAGEYLFFSAYLFNDSQDYNRQSRFAYVALRNASGTLERVTLNLEKGEGHGAIYIHDTLSTGVYELVGFTNWMRNQGEESYFRIPIVVVNRFDETLEAIARLSPESPADEAGPLPNAEDTSKEGLVLHAGPSRLGRRSRGSFQLQLPGTGSGHARVSVSIAPVASQLVRGESWHQPKAFSQTPTRTASPYYMETEGMMLSGQLIEKGSRQGLPGARVVLNTPDTLVNFVYAETDQQGFFHFLLNDYYYHRELFLSPGPDWDGQELSILIDDKYLFSHPLRLPSLNGMQEITDYIRSSQDILRVKKVYGLTGYRNLEQKLVNGGTPPLLYGRANTILYTDHYVPLDDVWEIARELAGAWRIRRSGSQITHSLIGSTTRQLLPGSPVFFVDGIMARDIGHYMGLSSPQLYKIEIHNLKWMHGNVLFPGIIGIFSKDPEINLANLNSIYTRTSISPPIREVEFDSSTTATASLSHANPDLRQLLLWKPEILLKKGKIEEVVFHTGELGGEYLITVRGMTSCGKPVFARERIYVQ